MPFLYRYGTDLQTLLDESKLTLSPESACQLACQVIDSYEYIHSKGYVHKDVKGSNLLFEQHSAAAGGTDGKGRKVFLVDYGLVSKYTHRGVHKPYVRDERCAHEGTLEYTARDFHLGCVSRRGDLEVSALYFSRNSFFEIYNIAQCAGPLVQRDRLDRRQAAMGSTHHG